MIKTQLGDELHRKFYTLNIYIDFIVRTYAEFKERKILKSYLH